MLQGLETPVLLLQVEKPEGAVDRQCQKLGFEGLGEEVVGPQRNGTQGVCLVVLACKDDDFRVRRRRKDLLKQQKAFGNRIGIGWQSKVHGHDRRIVTMELDEGVFPIACGQRLKLVE